MLRALRLTAALLAGLALPALALAQSTATSPPSRPALPVVPPATHTTPAAPAATTSTSAPVVAAGKRIDVNGASETDIATLSGIGPVTAKAIVAGRPWDDVTDLVKKKAMSQSVYDRNKDRFALANINTSSAADMAKTLPGIGDKTAPKIVSARPYAAPTDLVSKNVISQAQFDKIKDVVTY